MLVCQISDDGENEKMLKYYRKLNFFSCIKIITMKNIKNKVWNSYLGDGLCLFARLLVNHTL